MAETRYTREHVWARLEEDGTVTVGLTEHAQELLGEISFVELPELHRDLVEGETCGTAEGENGPAELFAPLAGTICELNELVVDDPALLNRDPEGEAWLFRLEGADEDAFEQLLDDEAYESLLDTL